MAAGQPQVVVAFAQALTELVTVEKKNIVLLTEIARDALRTDPAAAPGLAALISTRILQAAPSQKLPALYLLDSISKLVGEPYKTLFAATLPEVRATRGWVQSADWSQVGRKW
jgi:pre-mRNA cleavage complex 2 protein Pcf11